MRRFVAPNSRTSVFAFSRLMSQPKRDFHLAWHPTTTSTSPKGEKRLGDAGHVQIHLTRREQKKYGLPAVFGHSPDKTAKSHSPETVPVETSLGKFSVDSFVRNARGFGQDNDRGPTMKKRNMGMLSRSQATVLGNYFHSSIFEVTGKRKANCVHGTWGAMKAMYKLRGDIPTYMMPQELADHVVKAKKEARAQRRLTPPPAH
jgi:hypothetical protein